jgi:carboxymethylenebutenolidase
MIELHTADGPMPALECVPDGPAKGAVVVVQEAFGLTDHIGDVCQRFADAGWLAIAPALFHRQDSPVISYDDFSKAKQHLDTLDIDEIRTDLISAFDYLEAQEFDSDHIAVVGFCAGGTIAFYAGTIREVGAAVTFYGGGVQESRYGIPPLGELAPSMKCPWLGLYGDQDQGIPAEEVEVLRSAMNPQKHPAEIVRYSEAGHAFHCDARPEKYEAKSAEDAWQRTLNWIETFVGVARDPEQIT